MMGNKTKFAALALFSAAVIALSHAEAAQIPDPADAGAETGVQNIVLAGGCFWGMEGVFEHVRGVKDVVSGFTGGKAETAHYEMVSEGNTGHAESVMVTYDPSAVSLGQLLKIYFSVAHDPTELNRQGPDHGTQYRSEIFYTTPEQEKVAKEYIDQLGKSGVFKEPIVTKTEQLQKFYPAEDYHQDFLANHPNNPYIVANDKPKVAALKAEFPDLYTEKYQ
jgi:peptide-methionine (S)-S-oxide reductase